MAETYRLRHPRADTVVEVTSAARRDTFLRRGWTSVEGGETKPKAGQKRRSKPKADEE